MKKFNLTLTTVLIFAVSTTLARSIEIRPENASGNVRVEAATNRPNTMNVTIEGAAAQLLSQHLSKNEVSFVRDPWSGALVQSGKGLRCIDQNRGKALYCYIAVIGAEIK